MIETVTRSRVIVGGLLAVSATFIAGPACRADDSGTDACPVHFTKEGSFLSGRTYRTWVVAPSIAKDDAFTRVYTAIAKDGWSIVNSDKQDGVISASTSVSFGKGINAPLTVVVESSGTGSKLTATFHIAGGQASSEETVRTKLCTYLGAATTTSQHPPQVL